MTFSSKGSTIHSMHERRFAVLAQLDALMESERKVLGVLTSHTEAELGALIAEGLRTGVITEAQLEEDRIFSLALRIVRRRESPKPRPATPNVENRGQLWSNQSLVF